MNLFEKIKLLVRFKLWARLRANSFSSFYLSHSMFGEDMVVRALAANSIKNSQKGFYVDIGAFHPIFLSNTYHFYCNGWRGINIDATPGSMEAFNVLRPRDINIECCLSAKKEEDVDYFIFEESPYNTFDSEWANQVISQGAKLLEKRSLKTQTLKEVLDLHSPPNIEIDLMSIDVENKDAEILMSNNWEVYKPKFIILEDHDADTLGTENLLIVKYLRQYRYQVVTKCGPSIILQLI